MFVFIDTETGGLTTDYSLLTVAAAITDEDFNVLDTLCFGLRPATHYITHPEAMQVNKISLSDHARTALYTDTARTQFRAFLSNGSARSPKRRLIPAGHNVAFDLNFVWAQLLPESDWKQVCGYPAYDTAIIARFLASAGLIPSNAFSLVAMRNLFKIQTGAAHDAENDVLATIEVAKHFTAILKGLPRP